MADVNRAEGAEFARLGGGATSNMAPGFSGTADTWGLNSASIRRSLSLHRLGVVPNGHFGCVTHQARLLTRPRRYDSTFLAVEWRRRS